MNIVEPTHSYVGHGILVARSLFDAYEVKSMLSVMNINKCPVKLKSDTVLGPATQLSQVFREEEDELKNNAT